MKTHTHYALTNPIALVHLLLTAARFAPAVRASWRTVRASWLVYQVISAAKNILLYSLYWVKNPICPLSTKSLLRLHGFLLTRFFFQSLKKQRKQSKMQIQKDIDPMWV